MIIGIDIDDVVVATNTGSNGLLRRAWANLGRAADYIVPFAWDSPEWPDEMRAEYMRLLHTDALFDAGLCDARIPDVLKNLKHDFIFVTARPENEFDQTADQLRRCGIEFDPETQLFCVGTGNTMGSKIDVLRRHNVDLMIDDAVHNVAECLANGIDAILISNDDTTWNHSERDKFKCAPNLIAVLKEL